MVSQDNSVLINIAVGMTLYKMQNGVSKSQVSIVAKKWRWVDGGFSLFKRFLLVFVVVPHKTEPKA